MSRKSVAKCFAVLELDLLRAPDAAYAALRVLSECADGLGVQGYELPSGLFPSGVFMDAAALLGRSILVVEAEPFAALEVETGLRDAGAKVFGVHKLREALFMAEYPALSAAVVAQRLGKDDTTAVCRRLTYLGIPFMLHTRHDAAEARRQWPNAPVVAKPASSRELISTVASLLN